jgi:tRNA(Ile)-lysidine synthase
MVFLRNRIRHELLPLLRQYNPRIDEALLRLAEGAHHDLELIDQLADEALATSSRPYPPPQAQAGGPSALGVASPSAKRRLVLPRRRLVALPEALQRHALRLAVQRLVGDLREVQASHIEALVRALRGRVGHHLDLPRGLRLDVGYEDATLTLPPEAGSPPAPPIEELQPLPETPLPVPGCLSWGPWSLETEVGPLEGGPPEDPFQAWLDADTVGEALTVRPRRRGDRFQPLGMGQEKKLQDLLVDRRVPRGERDLVPLVCSPKGIAWVGGVRIAHWARVTAGTRRVMKLYLGRCDPGPS